MSACKTRVLIVGPSIRFLGGQAVQAYRLMDRLRECESLSVDYLIVDPELPAPLAWMQRVKFVRTLATSAAYVFSLLSRVWRTDTLHVFSASYWSFLLAPTPAMLVGRLFGKRVILNYHSGEADDHLTRWGWHARPLMRLADVIIVPTAYLVDVFARHGLHAIAIPNHLDADTMQYRERTALRPRYLSNRNFEKHYNVESVLRAFAEVQLSYPDAELVVAGDGSLRDSLHMLAAELRLRNVTFTGPVSPLDMPRLYQEADVYVNASLIDNMPLSLLEAYASGLPVITSDAGGIPWIAQDDVTARVITAGDTAALARAMCESIEAPATTIARAACARDYVAAQFSWNQVRTKWQQAYRPELVR